MDTLKFDVIIHPWTRFSRRCEGVEEGRDLRPAEVS